jgi:Arc/MetJ-type ribon-helix-helix transcriptional regulator
MSFGLSPQNERYLDEQVELGRFPSKEAALDAAVEALRSGDGIPEVPAEHAAALEEAFADLEKNGSQVMTDADWDDLRQFARDVAEGRATSED